MLAVDTNLIIRYLANDDARQAARARSVIDGGQVFVSATVLIESDWVLRSSYRYSREDAVAALRAFCGLPTVELSQSALIGRAFDWAANGMDLADALHIAAAQDCEAFASFDADLAKIAKRVGAPEVRRP